FSLNYRVVLAEEGCFDRSEASHALSLCDMHAKYADVVPTAEVLAYFDRLPSDLFDLPSGSNRPAPPAKQAAEEGYFRSASRRKPGSTFQPPEQPIEGA